MQGLKLMLVITLGLGITWAAWQIAPADSSAMLTGVAYGFFNAMILWSLAFLMLLPVTIGIKILDN